MISSPASGLSRALVASLALVFIANVASSRSSGIETSASLVFSRHLHLSRSLKQQLASGVNVSEPCGDHPPPDSKYTCDQQKQFGQCQADFMKNGDFCRRTCGRCDEVCNDVAPPGRFTCEDQRKFGKCDEPWVRDWGYCALTCERCSMKAAAALAANTPTTTEAATDSEGSQTEAVPHSPEKALPQVHDDAPVATGLAAAGTGSGALPKKVTPAPAKSHPAKPDPATHASAAQSKAAQQAALQQKAAAEEAAKKQAADAAVAAAAAATAAKGQEDAAVDHITVAVHHKHHSKYVYIHSALMAVAFGLVIPAGVFTSRYGKRWNQWFNVHRALQVLGYTVASAGFFLGLALHRLKHMERERLEAQHIGGRRLLHDEEAELLAKHHDAAWLRRHKVFLVHKYMGIAIFIVITLQVAAAIVRRPSKGSKLRATWAWSHWVAGWAALMAGLANCVAGVVLLQPLSPWWTALTAAVVAAILGTVAVLDIRRCMYGHQLEGYKQTDDNGGVELVGGDHEERQALTDDDPYGKLGGAFNSHSSSSSSSSSHNESEDEEELTMVTAKYAP